MQTSDLQDGNEHNGVEQARANEGGLLQVLIIHEADGSKELLPNVYHRDAEYSNNLHGDDVWSGPALRCVIDDAERHQNQREHENDKKDSGD